MDPLQEALQMLDEAAAIIQELVAQVQSKGKPEEMSKKAEEVALKLGVSFEQASDMIKVASESGDSIDSMVKLASLMKKNVSFGSVYTEEATFTKTGSVAQDKYLAREQELLDELNF